MFILLHIVAARCARSMKTIAVGRGSCVGTRIAQVAQSAEDREDLAKSFRVTQKIRTWGQCTLRAERLL